MTSDLPARSVEFATATMVALGIAFFAFCATAQASGATDVVQRFHERLMPVLGVGSSVSADRRTEPIRDAVGDTFHMPLIGRLVVGTPWNDLDTATKRRLSHAILKLNVATYLNRLGDGRLQSHRIENVRQGSNGTRLVDAVIEATSGPLRVTYVTRQLKGRWWIIDVLLDGQFSELQVRRNEYRGLIAKNGVPGLIEALERQTAELAVSRN